MTTNSAFVLALVVLAGVAARPADAGEAQTEPILVRTSSELLAALKEPGSRNSIHVASGRYTIDQPIVVPDDVVLTGDGVMRFDDDGMPNGFEAGTETTFDGAAGLEGDLVTLGNGAALHGLVLVDEPHNGAQRNGNVVAVVSRSAGDDVAAAIVECELISTNPKNFSKAGPTGRGIVVFTRNPWEMPRRPHEGASVSVRVERSVIHDDDDGGAVFVLNFASHASAGALLSHNRIDGTLIAGGGSNRPESISHSTTTIESDHNAFGAPAEGRAGKGWLLLAASSAPHFASDAAGPSFNTLRVHANGDRIEGFAVGVMAAAARRFEAGSGMLSDNTLELSLTDLRVTSVGTGAADLQLFATVAAEDQAHESAFVVGDRNVARVQIDRASGSGPRANAYGVQNGADNRIEFTGSADEFARSNAGIDPAPPAELFTTGD